MHDSTGNAICHFPSVNTSFDITLCIGMYKYQNTHIHIKSAMKSTKLLLQLLPVLVLGMFRIICFTCFCVDQFNIVSLQFVSVRI